MKDKVSTRMTWVSRPLRSPAGFTLMEMLAVILILAILLALVVGVCKWVMDHFAKRETAATQSIVIDAVMLYKSKTGVLPADDGSCAILRYTHATGQVTKVTAFEL